MTIHSSLRWVTAGATAAAATFVIPGEAAAVPATISCGATVSSVVKTEPQLFSTASTDWVSVSGAQVKVVVPAGQTLCVKVRFSISGGTSIESFPVIGRIRAVVVNGAPLGAADGIQYVATNSNFAAYTHQWAGRLGAGSHTVRMQARTLQGGQFAFVNWAMDVEVAK